MKAWALVKKGTTEMDTTLVPTDKCEVFKVYKSRNDAEFARLRKKYTHEVLEFEMFRTV